MELTLDGRVALVTGAILVRHAGQEASGSILLEPKILATGATWLVFLVLAVGRASGPLAGPTTAKVTLAGAVLVLLTFLLGHPYHQPESASTRSHNATEVEASVAKLEAKP